MVYADWLEERGETSRAELIRVQCELNRLPWHLRRHAELEKRELQLIRDFKDQWLGDYASLLRSARFERGFVERVVVGARQFLKHAEAILDRAPIQDVWLIQVSDASAAELAKLPALERIPGLSISGNRISDEGWRRLLGSQYLGQLRKLKVSVDFESGRTSPAVVLASLATCPSLPN